MGGSHCRRQEYVGTRLGVVGPVEAKLRSYERVLPLVFGAYGETSAGMEQLLQTLAELGADHHWRAMKAKNPEQAKGAVAWLLRRRWGMTALRENARLKLDRLQYIGSNPSPSSREARARILDARGRARADALEWTLRGPSIGNTLPAVATRWA